jgi:predicted nuclease of predicted toxin-antitoxin system
MKLLIDNNLSFKLVHSLQSSFPRSVHVKDVLTVTSDDISIWNYAKGHRFTILTKDDDFDDRSQLEGCPPKIVHLICGNKSTLHILNLILQEQSSIQLFGDSDSENCILKLT